MFVIAGASGRTGGVVAESLLAQREPVRVLVRDPGKGEVWRRRGAAVSVVSLGDTAGLAGALEGAAGFYALLPEELGAADFAGERQRVADAMAAAVAVARPRHVVFLSAAAAAVPDGNGLAAVLYRAEQALRETGVPTTVIRAGYFQENVLAALPAALADGIYPCFLPSADLAFPMVATRDVGRLAARCLREPPAASEVIDLTGPVHSIRQLAAALGGALGRDLRVVEVPAAAQVEVLVGAGLPRAYAAQLVELIACLGAGRVVPRGDRMVAGTTALADTLPGLIAAARAAGQLSGSRP